MTSRVFIASLTVVMFGAGYGARVWMERSRCAVPPAPALLGEISTPKTTGATAAPKPNLGAPERPPNAARLATEIENLRPAIEEFRSRMVEIDQQMDRDVLALLRPEQMPRWEKMLKRRVEYREKEEAGISADQPLTAEQIASLQQRPLYKLMAVVVVPQKLKWLANDLKLDAAQKEKAGEILRLRRDKFLALVDSSPPPSLTLSRLAPLAKQLGEPKK
ncbi:MAG: hypothetical protein ABIV50_13685 [Opitutus sp.]